MSKNRFGWQKWTNNALDEFNRRANCFRDQYSKYFVEEVGHFVSGRNAFTSFYKINISLKQFVLVPNVDGQQTDIGRKYSRQWRNSSGIPCLSNV